MHHALLGFPKFEYGSGTYIPIVIRLMFAQLEELEAFTIDAGIRDGSLITGQAGRV